ncbi:MAG: hypothetical protein S4CHLAM123_09850 [Chlamydiales bacterium]|nr:hypothetical protein [Chlamydiales bacterium]
MNFTREPIVETVITPKDGFKLVIRNSKSGGQEEFFVDAVEVISFGSTSFFRSLEKPKSFLVPVNDYEILETREVRISLKTTGSERGIKIGGGREAPLKAPKEPTLIQEVETQAIVDQKVDKRKERRRYRKKRTTSEDEGQATESQESSDESQGERSSLIPPPSTLIPPPSTLISDTIERYKQGVDEPEKRETILAPPPLVKKEEIALEPNKDDELPF